MSTGKACPKCKAKHEAMRTDGHRRCQGHSKQTGLQCGQVAVPNCKTCHWHGGKTPSGTASPHFKHGQDSKAYADLFSGWLREGYTLGDDPDLVNLTEDIRIWQARRHELVYRISEGGKESSTRWKALKVAAEAMDKARRTDNPTGFSEAYDTLQALVAGATDLETTWDDMDVCSNRLEKLKKEERKRREASEKSLSMDQVQHFAAMLTALALPAITDRVKLGEFIDAVQKLARGEFVQVDTTLLPKQQPFKLIS